MNRKNLNCWEYQNCGREPGGARSARGVCPAAVESALDGANRGSNGGRACWVVSGTLCNGRIHGDFEDKACECSKCAFWCRVEVEESLGYQGEKELLEIYESGRSTEAIG